MDKNNKEIINNYVVFPFVIENIEKSIEEFIGTGLGDRIIYELNLVATSKRVKEDYYLLKNLIRFKYGLDIRRVSTLQYVVNGEIIKYTADQLKKLSEDIMNGYFGSVRIKEEITPWGLLDDEG